MGEKDGGKREREKEAFPSFPNPPPFFLPPDPPPLSTPATQAMQVHLILAVKVDFLAP